MTKTNVPILMYHALTVTAESNLHAVHITVAAFEEQMQWLYKEGYTVLPLSEAVEALENGKALPTRSVVLTFDDGYLSLYQYARPILKRLGFEATLFLTTDSVGLSAYGDLPNFTYEGQPSGDRPLTWEELAQMIEDGWTIDSHSCSHPHLSELTPQKLHHEIADCKKVIEEHLNRPVRYYAYPYGDYNRPTLAEIQAAGYKAACTVHVGKAPSRGDLLRLPRIEVNIEDTLPSFIRKVETGYASSNQMLRSRVRNLLYASPAVKDLLSSALITKRG